MVQHCDMLRYSAIYCVSDIIDMWKSLWYPLLHTPVLRYWWYIEILPNPSMYTYTFNLLNTAIVHFAFRYQLNWVREIKMVNCLSIWHWSSVTRAYARHWWRTGATSMSQTLMDARCYTSLSSGGIALLRHSSSRMVPTPTRWSTRRMRLHYTSFRLTLHQGVCPTCHLEGTRLGRVSIWLKLLAYCWSTGPMQMLRTVLAILQYTELFSRRMKKCSMSSWTMTGLYTCICVMWIRIRN